MFHPVSEALTYPVIALFSFRASPDTDNATVSTIGPILPASHPSPTNSAPTIHSYLLPHSQGVHQPSPSVKSYMPTESIQKLTRYPSGRGSGGTGINGTNGGSTSQISSPVVDRLLDDDVDGPNERWSDRFSFMTKDSYGNLRCAFSTRFQSRVVYTGLQLYRRSVFNDVGGGVELFERFCAICRVSGVELVR